jgi:serine/threonine-protein kinase HipA
MAKRWPSKEIYVFADWKELCGPILMGVLRVGNVRGKEVFAFEYDRGWLKSDFVQVLDPKLQLGLIKVI